MLREIISYWIALSFLAKFESVLCGSRGPHVCYMQYNFVSSYVSAFYEHNAKATGCISSHLTPSSKEVHIINLQSGGPNLGLDGANVTLHIRHHSDLEVYESPFIVVLNSHKPITWHIESEGITNATQYEFIISRGSKIINAHSFVKLHHRGNMPFETEAFLKWGQHRFKAITSFADIQQANNIYLKVGISSGEQLSSVCNLTNELPPNIKAAYIQSKPANGCVVIDNAGYSNKDIHIIEVHSANTNPHKKQITDVFVDIRAKRKGQSINRDIILVLKAHREVNWRIRTRDIEGILDVMASGTPVDVLLVHMESIQIYSVDLHPYHQHLLLDFAARQYGPVVSYIEAQLANHFTILIEEVDHDVTTTAPPITPYIPVKRMFLPFHDKLPNGQEKHGHNQPHPSNTDATTILGRTLTEEIIKYMMVIECQNKGIQVILNKNLLQRYGINNEHLTLSDSRCHAESNHTHYILASVFNRCGMEFEHLSDRVLYKNTLTVRMLSQAEGSASSSLDDEIEGSAIGAVDPGMWDDEDYRKITVNFHCQYMTKSGVLEEHDPIQMSKIDNDHSVRYDLQIYDNLTSESPLRANQLEVLNLTTLFVEASIVADHHLKVFSEECWVSTSDNIHDEGERHTLIENSCPKDVSVIFQKQSFNPGSNILSQRHRFSFQVRPFFTKPFSFFYLHCKLSVCSENGILGAPIIRKCLSPEYVCVGETLKSLTTYLESHFYKMVFRGPIRLLPKSSSPIHSGRHPPLVPAQPDIKKHSREYSVETNKEVNCKTQQVVFEGLESASVVGIAFASFLIGVILTASLWVIHLKTDPLRRELQKRVMAAEGASQSGNSTPNSHTPMTVSA